MEYKTFDISAVEGKDYKGAEGTLAFAAGETEKTIEIEIIDDDTHEANETSRSRLQRAAPARPDDGGIGNARPIAGATCDPLAASGGAPPPAPPPPCAPPPPPPLLTGAWAGKAGEGHAGRAAVAERGRVVLATAEQQLRTDAEHRQELHHRREQRPEGHRARRAAAAAPPRLANCTKVLPAC